eukprot:SAG25_NODE_299_length_10186_cov_64.813621_5_plen_185_part_00
MKTGVEIWLRFLQRILGNSYVNIHTIIFIVLHLCMNESNSSLSPDRHSHPGTCPVHGVLSAQAPRRVAAQSTPSTAPRLHPRGRLAAVLTLITHRVTLIRKSLIRKSLIRMSLIRKSITCCCLSLLGLFDRSYGSVPSRALSDRNVPRGSHGRPSHSSMYQNTNLGRSSLRPFYSSFSITFLRV